MKLKKSRKKTKTKKARKLKKRSPLTESQCQRLGYKFEDLVEADANCPIKPNLSKILADHPKLKSAFRRGQLLQQLRRLAPVVKSISHAAIRLSSLGFDFETGQDLRNFLDGDPEAREIWETAEANAWIENREDLRATAKDGNVRAIQMIDEWFSGREQPTAPAADLTRLSQGQICSLIGVTRQTLLNWHASDRMPRNSDKSYNLGDVLTWYVEFVRQKATGAGTVKDRMRDIKTEKLAMDLAEQKGQLLDRGEVISGLVARHEKMVGAFRYKRRELALMLHGQTVDRIEELLGHFFDDIQLTLTEIPEYLKLSPPAETKLRELLEIVNE